MPADPYDAFPYGGRPVSPSHPDGLALHAWFRGIEAADPDRARVLELGCAEGANLAPMAFHLPEARFLGVDGSTVQIERATEARDRLGLDNLRLRAARFEELEPGELGEHDYVIAHGVISWVAPEVRRRLLDLARGALAPGGVLFLSYNCAPGWCLRDELAYAMRRVTRGIEDPREQVEELRRLLGEMVASPARETPYGGLLALEAQRALAQRDAYLLHEYLGPHRHAFRHGEMKSLLLDHGLRPFDELGHASEDARIERGLEQHLEERLGDRDAAMELTELMLFRTFRMTLACRDDASPREGRRADGELMKRLRFAGSLRPTRPRLSLEPDVHEEFSTPAGAEIAAREPMLKASLLELAKRWPASLGFEAIVERAMALLELRRVVPPAHAYAASEIEALGADLLELASLGHLSLRLREARFEPSEAPRVSALARWEAARDDYATNPLHEVTPLDALSARLVASMDGTRTLAALTDRARELAAEGELVLRDEGGDPLPEDERDALLPRLVEQCVQKLARSGLLEG